MTNIQNKYTETRQFNSNDNYNSNDISNSKNTSALFNLNFIKIIKEQSILAEEIEKKKLKEINDYYINQETTEETTEETNFILKNIKLIDICVNWIKSLKDIYVDLSKLNYTFYDFINIFTKEDRLIYLGLTLITIGLICYLVNQFIIDNSENNLNTCFEKK